jgi:hypothetical protein
MTDEQIPVEQTAEIVEAPEQDISEQPIEQPPAKSWSTEDEEEARLFGWKPPEEWQGEKTPGYIDNPQEFMDRVQRSRIFKTMTDKLSEQSQAQQEAMRRLETMQDQALQRQREQYEARLRMISAAQRKATENADVEEWDRLEAQRLQMTQQRPQEAPKPAQGPDPYVAEYAASENGAWLKNPILAQTAWMLVEKSPDLKSKAVKDQIADVEAEIRRMYPAYFPQPEAKAPQMPMTPRVDAGGLASSATGSSKFAKLPAEARQQFKKFAAEGLYEDTKKGQEEYANEYFAA